MINNQKLQSIVKEKAADKNVQRGLDLLKEYWKPAVLRLQERGMQPTDDDDLNHAIVVIQALACLAEDSPFEVSKYGSVFAETAIGSILSSVMDPDEKDALFAQARKALKK